VIEKPTGWRPAAPKNSDVRALQYADGRYMAGVLVNQHQNRGVIRFAEEEKDGQWFKSTFTFSPIVSRVRQPCGTLPLLHRSQSRCL
jgi:hypothetical protein